MKRDKLTRRTAKADELRARHNPPYRIMRGTAIIGSATTRTEARNAKRDLSCSADLHIEQRVEMDTDIGGRAIEYRRVR